MLQITIYTTSTCPYCERAKALLKRKGLKYTEINVEPIDQRKFMIEKAGGQRTVPQIFVGDKHIGGCDDLYSLEYSGELDALVKAK